MSASYAAAEDGHGPSRSVTTSPVATFGDVLDQLSQLEVVALRLGLFGVAAQASRLCALLAPAPDQLEDLA